MSCRLEGGPERVRPFLLWSVCVTRVTSLTEDKESVSAGCAKWSAISCWLRVAKRLLVSAPPMPQLHMRPCGGRFDNHRRLLWTHRHAARRERSFFCAIDGGLATASHATQSRRYPGYPFLATDTRISVLVSPTHRPQVFGDRVIPQLSAGLQHPFNVRHHRSMRGVVPMLKGCEHIPMKPGVAGVLFF